VGVLKATLLTDGLGVRLDCAARTAAAAWEDLRQHFVKRKFYQAKNIGKAELELE
jgi:hypothetical protein